MSVDAISSSPVSDSADFIISYYGLYKSLAPFPFLFYLLVSALVVILFYLLYTIAERHLTWSLKHLSAYCRLSPDLAGLTFLAFGNGAPDFFTAVFGASSAPEMILGSSIGSGLVITTVIFALVILASRKAPVMGGTTPIQEDDAIAINIHHGHQQLGMPAMVECFSAASTGANSNPSSISESGPTSNSNVAFEYRADQENGNVLYASVPLYDDRSTDKERPIPLHSFTAKPSMSLPPTMVARASGNAAAGEQKSNDNAFKSNLASTTTISTDDGEGRQRALIPQSKAHPALHRGNGSVIHGTANIIDAYSAYVPVVEPLAFLRNSILYLICVGFLLFFVWQREATLWQASFLIICYVVYMISVISFHFYSEGKKAKAAAVSFNGAAANGLSLQQQKEQQPDYSKDTSAYQWDEGSVKMACSKFAHPPLMQRFGAAIALARNSHKPRSLLKQVLRNLQAPIQLALNLTILPQEIPEQNSPTLEHVAALRMLHRIRAVINPFFSVPLYFYLISPIYDHICTAENGAFMWLALYIGIASAMSAYFFLTTFWDRKPRFYILHTIYAFSTCILWIYATSNELVSALTSTGDLLQISPAIMGIVFMAWGNSFGDMVTNIALARNGAFETAVSAIFSGPVQNVLLTIGCSFFVAAWKSAKTGHVLKIGAFGVDMYLASGFLLFTLLTTIIAVPTVLNYRLTRKYSLFLIIVYIIYVPLGVIAGLGLFGKFGSSGVASGDL